MKTALTIAGSDSCGGAGIQADLKVFSVLGVYGMSALTAVTAQNTLGVKGAIDLEPDFVREQIDAVAGDIQVDACKTGMLSNIGIIDVVHDCVTRHKLFPYVCDPVMVAKSGDPLLKPDAVDAVKRKLFPLATVITPNLRETALLTGTTLPDPMTIAAGKDLAKRLHDAGAKAVVIKAIPSSNGLQIVDLFYDGREYLEFAMPVQPKNKTHGSGCAFSAAITAGLAEGVPLVDAIDQAKQLVNMSIQYGDGQGRGTTPVNVLAFKPKKK